MVIAIVVDVVVVVFVVWHPVEPVRALDVLRARNYSGFHCLFFMGKFMGTHTVYLMEYGNCRFCCCCCFCCMASSGASLGSGRTLRP